MNTNDTTPSFGARKTVYKGVEMRSRLEAAWAEQFDALGWAWEYEPTCIAGEQGQYLPDFRVKAFTDITMYVEVKGGWWQNADARGINSDDLWTQVDDELSKMKNLVFEHDRFAVFMMLLQTDEGHEIYVWNKATAHYTGHAVIGRCTAGCVSLYSHSNTGCPKHWAPYDLVEFVPSLYGQQQHCEPVLDGLASFLHYGIVRPGEEGR